MLVWKQIRVTSGRAISLETVTHVRSVVSGVRNARPTEWLFVSLQILANVIIFICGNLAGAYHKHLMELALQQTYQDTCNCIKSQIKLEFEKRQQVNACSALPLRYWCHWRHW